MQDMPSPETGRSEPVSRIPPPDRGRADVGAVPPPALQSHPASKWWRGVALQLFLLGLCGAFIELITINWNDWIGQAADQTTDDAYLQSDLTPLSARVAGYIKRVDVEDYQIVHAGDLLVEIRDEDYAAEVAQAEANVAAATAAIDNNRAQQALQQANIEAADAAIQATQADLVRFHLEDVRQKDLLATHIAGTPQLVEQADANEKRTAATLEQNRAQAAAQRRQLSVLETQEKQLVAALDAQKAALDLAKINLGYTRVLAPVDGMVGQRRVYAGQYANVGTQLISIVPLPKLWVIANYKETQMTRIRVGQPADFTVDAFPGLVIKGRVDSWSPASGSHFSLLPPDNATGNFTKVVQRIPVKIVLDDPEAASRLLRPGMSVIATIHTEAATDASRPAR